MLYTEKDLFCYKYLKERGLLSTENLVLMGDELHNLTVSFDLVRKENEDFFESLAKPLRELWPAGEKDGKYPWRGSVKEIANRLNRLWTIRNLGKYSVDECLTVARRYLAQFQENTKYMKLLKYFILKQKSLIDKDGRINYINESQFADMLEGKSDQDAMEQELEALVEATSNWEGELV